MRYFLFFRSVDQSESGHAFAALRFGVAHNVAVSLARRDDSLGATRIERIMQSQTRDVIDREIAVHLAGRAAEDVILGSVTSGAGGGEDSDLVRATDHAIRLVAAYGLSKSGGLVWHGKAMREHLVLSHPKLNAEVHAILERCYRHATDLVRREQEAFGRLIEALIARRGLDHAEIAALIGEPPEEPPSVHRARLGPEASSRRDLTETRSATWTANRSTPVNSRVAACIELQFRANGVSLCLHVRI